MKKMTFVLLLLVNILVAQNQANLDMNGIPLTSEVSGNRFVFNQAPAAEIFGDVRALSEINTGVADGYPWLSTDGLRLYYTHGNNSLCGLNFTQRATTESEFEQPTAVSIALDSINSSWFSQDELDVYIVASPYHPKLHFAKRETPTAAFGPPVEIELIGITYINLNGPSLNAAQDKLWLHSSGDLLVFYRTSATAFTYQYSIADNIANYGPGQLSKDELNYFFSYQPTSSGYASIYQMTRDSVLDDFDPEAKELVGGVNNASYNCIQPSVSGSLGWIAYTRNNDNTWNGNDLYIARNAQLSVKAVYSEDEAKITIYPNPSNGIVHFNLKADTDAQLEIIDNLGQTILKSPLPDRIDLTHYSSGIYFAKITTADFSETKKIILQ